MNSMNRRAGRAVWIVLLASLILIPMSAAALDTQRRRPQPAPVAPANPVSIVEMIDGTPRPAPAAGTRGASALQPGATQGRWTPPRPGDRTVTSLSTIIDYPGMASPLGGDDILITSLSTPIPSPKVWLEITNDGRMFVAVEQVASPLQLDVYRSTDGGDTWTLWSSFAPGPNTLAQDFTIAEGNADRAFIAFSAWNGASLKYETRVAHADLNAGTPVWTAVTVFADPTISFASTISLATDAWAFSDYYIYLLARADDGNGFDIWVTRSTDLGDSYEVGFKIQEATDGSPGWTSAWVTAGKDGYIHALFTRYGATDNGLFYRRAANYAGAGWDPRLTLDGVDNGNNTLVSGFGAGRVTDDVMVFGTTGGSEQCRYSADQGATWPVLNTVATGFISQPEGNHILFPGLELAISGYQFGNEPGTEEFQFARSATGAPGALAAPEGLSISTTTGFGLPSAIALDPSRGDRLAAVWVTTDATDTHVRFDAEWRRDPGYPNTDIGFPIAIAGGGQTPPAVANVDSDSYREIVFGTRSGDIYVVNHDGTVAAGWPVNIGTMPFDGPVAVGDLRGNGVPSIVAGNDNGQVFAFTPEGTLLPGWPVTMNEVAPVFVSIGALGPPRPRYVVAVCGTEMRIIPYPGQSVPATYQWSFPDSHSRPAAIGDVNNDGVTDIVSLKGSWFHVNRLGLVAPQASRLFSGEFFSDAPTLADIDGNGTLEIAAPTVDGKMYLLNADGTNYSGSWPITVSPGVALTAAALGNILGGSEPELVFAESTGAVHIRWSTGVEQSSYPKASGASLILTPPMLSPVNIIESNVNLGIPDGPAGTALSWRNLGMVPDGWPRSLPGAVEETFASGDIDNDGRNELVVLGVNFLTVLDVGVAPASSARDHWPMYGYNAQRTGCLDCGEILTGIDDTPAVARKTSIEIHPNPFNPTTTIEYEVALAGRVTLEVFDVSGRLVATVIDNEHREAGRYATSYHARGASGVYFARLQTADGEVTRKMVVLK